MFCRSLFVLLYFFFWPLCCLFFFDIRLLITRLVSSNSSHKIFLILNNLITVTSIEMYFMSGICAFVANLIKKYKKWKVVASGFYWVRVAHLFSFLYCAVCFPPCLSLFLSGVSNVASVSGFSILDCPFGSL